MDNILRQPNAMALILLYSMQDHVKLICLCSKLHHSILLLVNWLSLELLQPTLRELQLILTQTQLVQSSKALLLSHQFSREVNWLTTQWLQFLGTNWLLVMALDTQELLDTCYTVTKPAYSHQRLWLQMQQSLSSRLLMLFRAQFTITELLHSIYSEKVFHLQSYQFQQQQYRLLHTISHWFLLMKPTLQLLGQSHSTAEAKSFTGMFIVTMEQESLLTQLLKLFNTQVPATLRQCKLVSTTHSWFLLLM